MKGLLAKKLGMTQLFNETGSELAGVTVLEAGPCYVVQVKTDKTDGYNAIQIGFGAVREERTRKTLTKAARGHLGLLKTDAKHSVRKPAIEGMPALRHLRDPGARQPFTIDEIVAEQHRHRLVGRHMARH